MPIKKPKKYNQGFTLAEMMVAIVISLLILMTVSSAFLISQKTFRKANTKAELTQNARIVLDLMSREIRQAKEIITVLPADDSNPATVAHQIEFENGHDTNQIKYVVYFLVGSDLKRQTKVYYFDTDPDIYVYWNDIDNFGAPNSKILDEKLIGENFTNINFYGQNVINIDLNLEKNNEQVELKSVIKPRNI